MAEIGPMQPHEWTWLVSRSLVTGWAQLNPLQQASASAMDVSHRIQAMLTRAVTAPGATALVAREDGSPVGYLIVTVVPDELTGQPSGLFVDIFVEPQWRRTGLAGQLTAAGEEHLRDLGIREVRRWIAYQNPASLRHAQKDGCEVEKVMMLKRL